MDTPPQYRAQLFNSLVAEVLKGRDRMKQEVVVQGVTLTRQQVEQALKDLNTPEAPTPGTVWVPKDTNRSVGRVIVMGDKPVFDNHRRWVLDACIQRIGRDYPFSGIAGEYNTGVNYTNGSQWWHTSVERFHEMFDPVA